MLKGGTETSIMKKGKRENTCYLSSLVESGLKLELESKLELDSNGHTSPVFYFIERGAGRPD